MRTCFMTSTPLSLSWWYYRQYRRCGPGGACEAFARGNHRSPCCPRTHLDRRSPRVCNPLFWMTLRRNREFEFGHEDHVQPVLSLAPELSEGRWRRLQRINMYTKKQSLVCTRPIVPFLDWESLVAVYKMKTFVFAASGSSGLRDSILIIFF